MDVLEEAQRRDLKLAVCSGGRKDAVERVRVRAGGRVGACGRVCSIAAPARAFAPPGVHGKAIRPGPPANPPISLPLAFPRNPTTSPPPPLMTPSSTYLPQSLAERGLADRFQAVVTSADVQHCKPAPDIFVMAAEKLGLKPEECVVSRGQLAWRGVAWRGGSHKSHQLLSCQVAVLLLVCYGVTAVVDSSSSHPPTRFPGAAPPPPAPPHTPHSPRQAYEDAVMGQRSARAAGYLAVIDVTGLEGHPQHEEHGEEKGGRA